MRKVFALLAVASATVAQSQYVSLVIARDGAEPVPEAERIALLEPTEESIARLVERGYHRVSIDNWGVLLVDRTAPPLRDARIERMLLTELPLDGKPVPFGTLSPDAQRALANGFAGGSLSNHLAADTLVAFNALSNFRFTGDGRSHTQIYGLAGPSHEQMKQMASKPAQAQTRERQAAIAARIGTSRAELAFDRRQAPEAQAELYKRCTEEISKLVEAELKARDEARLRALRHLAASHQIPDNSWTKDSIPADVLISVGTSMAGGWAARGFDSRESARAWFDRASLNGAYVTFNLTFADGAAISNTIVTGLYEFGSTRR